MRLKWSTLFCTMLGYCGDRILRFQLPRHGFSEGQTNAVIWSILAVLLAWCVWSYFKHKDDAKREEAKFEDAFQKALKERSAE